MLITVLLLSALCVLGNGFDFGGDVYFTYSNKNNMSGLRIIYTPENHYERGKGHYFVGMYSLNAFINIRGIKEWMKLSWTHHGYYFYRDVNERSIHPGQHIIYSVEIYDKLKIKPMSGLTSNQLLYQTNSTYIVPPTIEYCDGGFWEIHYTETRCDAVIARLARTTAAPTTQPQDTGSVIAVGVIIAFIALVVVIINVIVFVKTGRCWCKRSPPSHQRPVGQISNETGLTTDQSAASLSPAIADTSQVVCEIPHHPANGSKTISSVAELQDSPPTYASLFQSPSGSGKDTDVTLTSSASNHV